jgi:DNA-binding IclR family transcriptional regulator
MIADDHTVLGRALAVINAVAEHGPHVRLAELAAVTGIPKPTALRIANSLADRQLLTRTDGGYALGPEIRRLGEKASQQRDSERSIDAAQQRLPDHVDVALQRRDGQSV